MFAILRRELGSYFTSPIGYVFLAVFYVFSGFYFFASTLYQDTTRLTGVFTSLFTIIIFLIPVLTMRLMSEEKKNKTDQVLITAPINLTSLVMGKFLAATIVYLMGVAITVVYAVVIATFAPPDWSVIFGNIIGISLLGAALIAIGMFISSLTENQVIAAVGGFAVGLMLILIDSVSSAISVQWIASIFNKMSFMTRYNDFTIGVLNISNVLFFISVCAVFIFLTVRVFEKRRWS